VKKKDKSKKIKELEKPVEKEIINDQSSMLNEESPCTSSSSSLSSSVEEDKAIELDTSASVNSQQSSVDSPESNDEEVKSDIEIIEEDLAAMNERNLSSSSSSGSSLRNPDELPAELKCEDVDESDTHLFTFNFVNDYKGKIRRVNTAVTASDEKAAWLKCVRFLGMAYPSLQFVYNQVFTKVPIAGE